MSQDKLQKALIELYEAIERSLPRKNAQVARALDRVRLSIADILAKYADADGVIPRQKLNALLNELLAIEAEIYRNVREEIRVVLQNTSEQVAVGLIQAYIAAVGVGALLGYAGVAQTVIDAYADVGEALFAILMRSTMRRHTDSMVGSAFSRIGDDGLVLNDRLRNIATILRKEVEVTLRESIRKGEGTTKILRRIDRVFRDHRWRLDTITETETLFVLRHSVAKFAQDSGTAVALRIIDFPHGKPGEHERHKCYIYARSNEHGLGRGVYPVGTRKIQNPHPRCRSVLVPVLVDELS